MSDGFQEVVAVAPGALPDSGESALRRMIRIAVPLIFNQGSVIMMLFVDRMFLSWYGTDEISAVWPATFLHIACNTVFLGTLAFINVFVAQYHGAGNRRMCASAVWQGVYFSLGAYLILLAVIPFGRQVFDLFGHRPEIARLERTYYTVLMAGVSITFMFNNVFAAFFTGRGQSHITMSANVAGNLLNVFLAWVLIFGRLGAPRLGMLGAALATAISSALPPAIMCAFFLGRSYQPEYGTRTAWKPRPRFIRRLVRMGFTSGAHDLTYFIAVTLFFMFMGRALPESLAANNIAWSINDLLTLYIHGIALAGTTVLAQFIGAGKPEEGERLAYLVVRFLIGMSLVIGVFYLVAPEVIFKLFRPRIERPDNVPFDLILGKGRVILLLMIGYNVLNPLVYTFRQALRGAGDTSWFVKGAVPIDVLLFIPGILLAARYFGSNYIVLWCCFLIYLAVLGTAHFLRFRSGVWKRIDRDHLYEEM